MRFYARPDTGWPVATGVLGLSVEAPLPRWCLEQHRFTRYPLGAIPDAEYFAWTDAALRQSETGLGPSDSWGAEHDEGRPSVCVDRRRR